MSYDNQLQQAVLAELNWEPSVSAAYISVSANAGVVTLTGYVENYAAKHAAETAVRRVKGVKAVVEQLGVHLSMDTKRDDEAIAMAAVDRLAWDVSVPHDAIKVTVEKGWVTLAGEVDWKYQKDAAEQDVRSLWGVVGVSNQTTIKPQVNTADLDHHTMDALNRSWCLDPNQINVTAEGEQIRLIATVNSSVERQAAESTARAAPDATSVKNDIVVV